jgi:tetratricopeptide (TPR) repeat protein
MGQECRASRVQVSPELIEVATADAKWQQPFDASLTDVFQVQADIAGRVAEALDVAIGSRQQQVLEDRPTGNLAAYDAFLKGQAIRALGPNPTSLRQAIGFFEQAVALDSTFVQAWAALSLANSALYANGAPSPATADRARSAAERALALKPDFPGGYGALGGYYRLVTVAPTRAVERYTKGLALAPGDADLLRGLGLAEQSLGRWEQAVEHLRRSQSLDPRSPNTAGQLGVALLWLRRYPEAKEALDRALALGPSSLNNFEAKVMVFLAQGDLSGARSVLANPPADVDLPSFVAYMATYWDLYEALAASDRGLQIAPGDLSQIETRAMIFVARGDSAAARQVLKKVPSEVDPAALVSYVANFYDLFWLLDEAQRTLLFRLTPSHFDDDRGAWGISLAGAYAYQGDSRRAKAYADSARAAFEEQIRDNPDDAQLHALHGVALAYLGRKPEAIREGERGVELGPISRNAFAGPYNVQQLARIYTLVGEPEKAIDQLESLVKIQYFVSPGRLKVDPTFDPIRKNPRFERLVDGER